MMTIACPWCDEDAELSLATLTSTDDLVCASCGTTVRLTEEPGGAPGPGGLTGAPRNQGR